MKKSPLNKKSKNPIPALRHKADQLFSKAIRYRDGELRGDIWWCLCITCDTWKPMGIMHAGHFMSRRFPSTRWDEENVNAQCAGCNMFGGGEQYKYSLALDIKYGDGTAEKLALQAQEYFKVTRQFLEQVISDAQAEIKFYEQNKE